ncbi:MAG: hypothetical protein ACU85V_19020, partial [Gammaproteobacteria bacterium]
MSKQEFEAQAEAVVEPATRVEADVLVEQKVHPLQRPADPVQEALNHAAQALLQRQDEDGHWRFDLEADATIPSEYILLQRFLERSNPTREEKIGHYLRRRQNDNGSWSLYHGGPGDMSATVKAYFALKMMGHDVDAPHMAEARRWVLSNGGAESVNVFTRIALAIFGQVPWRTVPAMPVEIMFLPKWWFFNLSKVSYWSRCVIVPLLIIFAKRPVVHVEDKHAIRELFLSPPESLRNLDKFHTGEPLKNCFIVLDRILKIVDPMIPKFIRSRAVKRAENWMRDHAKGKGGIGAIYPAIANAVMALKLLGAPDDDPDLTRSIQAIEDLVLDGENETYCQPCVSPIWDTCLSLTALTEAGAGSDNPAVRQDRRSVEQAEAQTVLSGRNDAPNLNLALTLFQSWFKLSCL